MDLANHAPAAGVRASFRDPDGRVIVEPGRVLRHLNAGGWAAYQAFAATRFARAGFEDGRFPATRVVEQSDAGATLEHAAIPFPSYPYEWSPEMLHAAGRLTLELAQAARREGFGLKDATPYNVLFDGPRPVFIDLASFEGREAGDPTWLACAQFQRTFLLPLLANRHFGLGLDQIFLSRRDGLEPEEVYRLASPLQRLRPGFFGAVSMPRWLGARHSADDRSIYQRRLLDNTGKAQFILERTLAGQARALARLAPPARRDSVWSGYMETHSYAAAQFQAKERFVAAALAAARPRRVLDAGCNTGHFSALAARAGASVVALDYDPAVAGSLWRRAAAEKLDILPLAVNLTRPSPGAGWRNAETRGFLDRAAGAFDLVLMLALVHHMLVTERIPLDEILDLAAELSAGHAVIEYVGPADPMFQRLVRGREALHRDLSPQQFEAACERRWRIRAAEPVAGLDRRLYWLEKRTA